MIVKSFVFPIVFVNNVRYAIPNGAVYYDCKRKAIATVMEKKQIPFIQELRSVETNEGMKNYMFDAITQINKASRKKERKNR